MPTTIRDLPTSPKLPSKPSALLRLMLKNLAQVEKDKRYKVSMPDFHTHDPKDKKTSVCGAGSIAAKTLKVSPKKTLDHPMWFVATNTKTNQRFMHAVDSLRRGDIRDAFQYLKIKNL